MKVTPVKMEKVRLLDIDIGDVFTFNGLQYIKLAEDSLVYAVPALSIQSIATVDITENMSVGVEKKIVDAYFKNVKKYVSPNLVEVSLPDADTFRRIYPLIKSHISDCWYIDNGKNDTLCGDEFMFVDSLNNIRKGSPSNAVTRQITEKLNVRILGYIEPFAEVWIPVK